MTLDFAARRKYYNLCDPHEALTPTDARNLDIDNCCMERVRGIKWVERLAERIELSNTPVFELFTGLPGSGKSTELRRLQQRLEREDKAHLLTISVDAEEVLDLSSPIDIPDIYSAILLYCDNTLLCKEGKNPEIALREGYMSRLWHWLSETDIDLTKAEFSGITGAKLVMEMKTRPSLRARVRRIIATHLSTFLKEARDELVLFEARAKMLGYNGLVVIFDSLEKLRGISTNWHEVLGSAEKLFAGGAPYLRLPVHVLYTIPSALVTRQVADVQFLPMIKLHDQDGNTFPPGYAAAREIIRKRIPDDVLQAIFGDQVEMRVEELIRWSGGYPRELIRLLQMIIAMPSHPITPSDQKRVVNELCDTYRKVVPASAFAWLAKVKQEKYVTIRDEDHREIVDLMLSNNAVLRYVNDNDWFDLHPAVACIPGIIQAEQAQRAVGGAG